MSTTNNIVALGHSSTIAGLMIPNSKHDQIKDQPFIYDSTHAEKENAFLDLIQFFQSSSITNEVFYKFISPGNHLSRERLILQFSLATPYVNHFSLLRGLFAFGKFNEVTVSSNSHNKTLQVEISSDLTKSVLVYFENIFSEVLREIKFKSELKKVILAQKEVAKVQKESMDRLYSSLL